MPRYRLLIEYDGGPYNGFQAQADQPTVQGALEAAIRAFSGEEVRIAAAGRTDTGVHATGQVIHVDLARDWPAQTVMNAMNAHLVRERVAVLHAELAPEGFHARFSARGRQYRYRILMREAQPTISRGQVWHIKRRLDLKAMDEAGRHLVGRHDFTTFRDAACQAESPVKTLDEVSVSLAPDGEAHLRFAARSFLHRQVRSMVGSLVEVGLGRWSPGDLKAALEARDRSACGPVAPATGLYLTGVVYDDWT
jgi:tRNA pseudouridine38-40 synthase